MREDLLHFIWKYKKLPLHELYTSKSESVVILDVGLHNQHTGPDFFNAKIKIAGQLWAGNIEVHRKASDWYAHRHQDDTNYDNVILHVVWCDDAAVFRKDGTEIPTLELKNTISPELLDRYGRLFDQRTNTFINCDSDIAKISAFTRQNWLDRLYVERLEQKSKRIEARLKASINDWEQVLFALLLQNFGLTINRESFLSLADNLPFSLVRKLGTNVMQIESVFFGMSHLLNDASILDAHYLELKSEYRFLKQKFDLNAMGVLKPEFYKLRPMNFPTIRLSQLANLYAAQEQLFHKVIDADDLNALYAVFKVSASTYWNNHYTFGKSSKKRAKRLSKRFIDLVIINTILPLKFCYARYHGREGAAEVTGLITKLKAEKNTIVSNFNQNHIPSKSAFDSQALIQLYNAYCTRNRCLQCAIGTSLLHGND